MQAFAAALALDARDPEVYFNRANFRFQAGQLEEALQDLDAAVKLKRVLRHPFFIACELCVAC